MNKEFPPGGYRKVIQKFSRAKLEEFRHIPAGARLAWLEEIKRLYWKAAAHRNGR